MISDFSPRPLPLALFTFRRVNSFAFVYSSYSSCIDHRPVFHLNWHSHSNSYSYSLIPCLSLSALCSPLYPHHHHHHPQTILSNQSHSIQIEPSYHFYWIVTLLLPSLSHSSFNASLYHTVLVSGICCLPLPTLSHNEDIVTLPTEFHAYSTLVKSEPPVLYTSLWRATSSFGAFPGASSLFLFLSFLFPSRR